jgi:hypothetical protein
MRDTHNPTIKRHDGAWMVDCPECRRALASSFDGYGELPIGIGIPLDSELTALRLKQNHERRRSGRPVPDGRGPWPSTVPARR